MKEKRFFHKTRQPSAAFLYANRIYSGKLAGFWQNGLEIQIDGPLDTGVDTEVYNISIGENGNVPLIHTMEIVHSRKNGQDTTIELSASNQSDVHRLREAIDALLQTGRRRDRQAVDRARIPRFSKKAHYSPEAVQRRLEWARQVSGSPLSNIAKSILKPESLAGNIENYIGAVQIPVGLAGPLLIRGSYVDEYVPLPIATTEGALISSISRGAKACNLSGGVHVHVQRQHMVRAPVFFCDSMEGAVNLEKWVQEHLPGIRDKAESVSSVARLEKITPVVFGKALHLKFYFTTGDAAGQNMTSACTWIACEWIARQVRDDPFIKYLWHNIEANMSGDKKANYQNFIEGRGVTVTASCFINRKVLKRILRVTPERFARIWSEAEFCAHETGMLGSNINFANVIAGIFAATGQDMACIHESATGIFKAYLKDDGLEFAVLLPSLVAGTVGGGTKLPVQKECLELMGCYGQGGLFRFAEIVAGACLSLDISTGAAIVTNDFVSAHERLGRNRPAKYLTKSDINEKFFTDLLDNPDITVTAFKKLPRKSCSGIISTITGNCSSVHGLHRYLLSAVTPNGHVDMPTFLKLKASNRELEETGLKVARLTGEDRLPGLYESQGHIFGFENSHLREINIYRNARPELLRFCPAIYGTMINHQREIYAVLMEDLTGNNYYDSIFRIHSWDDQATRTVLRDMAAMHALYLDRYEGLDRMNIQRVDKEFVNSATALMEELTHFNARRYPDLIPDGVLKAYRHFLRDMDSQVDRMLSFPMTLTHNDFNPRNLCIRTGEVSPATVLYDWELALFQNPQHDLIEFLVFVMRDKSPRKDYLRYADFYIQCLEKELSASIDRTHFVEVLDINALFFALVRMNIYLLGHNILKLEFLERVYTNLSRYISEIPRI